MPGIPKLQASVDEAAALIKNQIRRGEGLHEYELTSEGVADLERRLLAWEKETDELLRELFDTSELAEGFQRAAGLYADLGKTEMEKIQVIGGRVTYKLYNLKEVLQQLPEYQQAPKATPIESADEIFWDLIHPAVTGIAKPRFDAGHYADSVEATLKYINSLVKAKVKKITGNELDGSSLMNTAFSPKNPLITLDDLSTDSGKNIQLGYMQIFAGAMTGIRNPKAHDVIAIDKKRAIHLLFLSSLLMYKLDEAI